jgi:integrase
VSIERVERDSGVVWRVRWRHAGHNHSKVLGRKRDAEAFDAEMRRRKRTGEIAAMDVGKETLAQFGEDWWRLYAEPNLAPRTLQVYATLWDAHILPRLGRIRLRELTPTAINCFRLDLETAGVGPGSVAKTLTLLQGVLQRACEWERLQSNPARAVRKPSGARKRSVTPLAPETVEEMRHWLLRRNLIRDATLVSVLAYAGLRPGEAFALTWAHVRERTLLIEAAVSLGQITETKTRRRRTVRMLAPLGQDLAKWRLHCGRPDPGVLVFPGHDGWPWSAAAWKNWRRRAFGPAAAAAGVPAARPYEYADVFVMPTSAGKSRRAGLIAA